jgi:hypothetical protein
VNLHQVAIIRPHDWTLHVETLRNEHGLSSASRATRSFSNSGELSGGMEFQLERWWQIRIVVRADEQHDVAAVNLALRI